jgi:hypothetical protein
MAECCNSDSLGCTWIGKNLIKYTFLRRHSFLPTAKLARIIFLFNYWYPKWEVKLRVLISDMVRWASKAQEHLFDPVLRAIDKREWLHTHFLASTPSLLPWFQT